MLKNGIKASCYSVERATERCLLALFPTVCGHQDELSKTIHNAMISLIFLCILIREVVQLSNQYRCGLLPLIVIHSQFYFW